MQIGQPVTREEIPAQNKGATGEKYAAVWSAVDCLAKDQWLPVTLERASLGISLVQTARNRGYRATQRDRVVYVCKGDD